MIGDAEGRPLQTEAAVGVSLEGGRGREINSKRLLESSSKGVWMLVHP